MTDEERKTADRLIAQIELAAGELAPRDGRNATVITQIVEACGGLRSLLQVVRSH